MGDAQSALKLASGVALVTTGAGAEEAQGIGVNGPGDPVGLEGCAEVAEVSPCGIVGHEMAGEVGAGMIVRGEQ